MKQECIFCSIIHRNIPATAVVETDDILVIKDIAPKAPIHLLIIPKQHIAGISALKPDNEIVAGKMLTMAHKLADEFKTNDFRLIINNGALQHVPHLHMHFLAGPSLSNF